MKFILKGCRKCANVVGVQKQCRREFTSDPPSRLTNARIMNKFYSFLESATVPELIVSIEQESTPIPDEMLLAVCDLIASRQNRHQFENRRLYNL